MTAGTASFLPDFFSSLLKKDRRCYDWGSKLGYLEAIVNFALAHPNYAEPFRTIISEKLTANRD